jgi:hypothetical protein
MGVSLAQHRDRCKTVSCDAMSRPSRTGGSEAWLECQPRALLTYGLAVGPLSVTKMMRFVLLWWTSRLPSRVGLMCLTMPA